MTDTRDATLAILRARSRQAAMITLVGGLLVLGAIAFSAWQLHSLSARKRQLQAEYAAAQDDLSKLRQTRVALQADIRAGQDTLARIRLQLATDNVAGGRLSRPTHHRVAARRLGLVDGLVGALEQGVGAVAGARRWRRRRSRWSRSAAPLPGHPEGRAGHVHAQALGDAQGVLHAGCRA
jgi:hypothetical protein